MPSDYEVQIFVGYIIIPIRYYHSLKIYNCSYTSHFCYPLNPQPLITLTIVTIATLTIGLLVENCLMKWLLGSSTVREMPVAACNKS